MGNIFNKSQKCKLLINKNQQCQNSVYESGMCIVHYNYHCKICYNNISKYAYMPCGHLCVCESCRVYDKSVCIMCKVEGSLFKIYY